VHELRGAKVAPDTDYRGRRRRRRFTRQPADDAPDHSPGHTTLDATRDPAFDAEVDARVGHDALRYDDRGDEPRALRRRRRDRRGDFSLARDPRERSAGRPLATHTPSDAENPEPLRDRAGGAAAKTHPDVAAALYAALGLRILEAGKSRYHAVVLGHLADARRCYRAAHDQGAWEELLAAVRRDHRRKTGFLAALAERLARAERPRQSWLERARKRWTSQP